MLIAILIILIVVGIMLIRRMDFLIYAATDGFYKPWYWRIREFLFDRGPIFRP